MNHIPIIHDSEHWHDLRSRHVGGSEIAALFDLPADQRPNYMLTRFALWHVKAGNAPPPPVDKVRTRWGLRLEDVIADAVREETGWTVERGGYVKDATTPGLGCTLDFIGTGAADEDGPGAIETKNVDWMVHRRSWTDSEPPLHIALQLQHQLSATGYTWGCVAALVGGNELRLYRYKARPRIIADIRRRVREFWASIDEGREPPIDGSDGASHVLRALYPEPDDEAADLHGNPEFAEWCQEFAAASEDRAAAAKRRDEAENHILRLLGNHQRGEGDGFSAKLSIGRDIPDRPALPGEIIRGRRGSRTLRVKELVA